MKTLLRSCFLSQPQDKAELILRNVLTFQESGLGFQVLEDTVIWNVVKDFVQAHNHPPQINTLFEHFRRKGEGEVVTRLQMLMNLPSLSQGDFLVRLEDKSNDRRRLQWEEILKTAAIITSTGLEVKQANGQKTILRGTIDAAHYVVEQSHGIVVPTLSTRLSGEITGDGQAFTDRYDRVKADPLAGIGQFTGITQMDEGLAGAKKWEMWLHAAFTGGLKSTFALNWAYNQSVYYLHDSLYFSLEMPYEQVRNILFAMHTAHEKFKAVRHRLGIQNDPEATVGLEYGKIRDGTLTPNEEKFLKEYVVPDFDDPANDYGKIHIEVADPEKNDFTIADMRMKAELIYSKSPFSMIIVDHAGLMSPRKWVASTTERQNEVIRDLKKMAMGFHRGQGMAIVVLYQINREGYKRITKAQEKAAGKDSKGAGGGSDLPPPLYSLTDLSYANEAERSSDIITAAWIDDTLREKNLVLFQCLKSRDQAPFKPFYARVEWPCRRIYTMVEAALPGVEELQSTVDALVDEVL